MKTKQEEVNQIIIEGFIWVKKEKYDTEYTYTFFEGDSIAPHLQGEGHAPLIPYTIRVAKPDRDSLYSRVLDGLKTKRLKVIATNQRNLDLVEEEIQNFMALSYSPDSLEG